MNRMQISGQWTIDDGRRSAIVYRLSSVVCGFVVALSLVVFSFTETYAQDRWALLIGINQYITGEGRYDLKGCETDVHLMRELLISKYGFKADHIKVLLSREATKEHILEAFRRLADQAKPGDTVVFHYSGHGFQVPDRNGDEEDGVDEVFCPADIDVPGFTKAILDDELSALLDQIRANDVTMVLDACHSGTGTRDIQMIPRYLPVPGTRAIGKQAESTGYHEEGRRRRTLIAASKAEELAADAAFFENNQPFYAGALTYHLTNNLRKAGPTTTYAELMRDVIRDVKRKYPQTPQLEGDTNRPILSYTRPEEVTQKAERITAVSENRVRLGAGSAGGVTLGSLYAVFPKGETAFQGEGVGRIQVVAVGADQAEAHILSGAGRIAIDDRAVEQIHGVEIDQLFLRLTPTQYAEQIRNALSAIPFVQIVDESHFFDHQLGIEAKGSVFNAYLITGGDTSRTVSADALPELVQALHPLLENAYAIKRLAQLDNPDPPFKVSVWGGTTPGAEGTQEKYVDLDIGRPITFHVRSEREGYLTLINVDTQGEVTVLFPNLYHKGGRIQPGEVYSIPSEEMGFQIRAMGPPGRELVKAIVTERPVELSELDTAAQGEAFQSAGASDFSDRLTRAMVIQVISAQTTQPVEPAAPVEERTSGLGLPVSGWSTDYMIVQVR